MNNKLTYAELAGEDFDISSIEIDPMTPEEVRREGVKRLTEIHREMKPLEMEKRRVLSVLSDPLKKKEVLDLTISSAQNIMANCTLTQSEEDVLYKDFTEEDKDLLKGERSMKINNVFGAVSSDVRVKEGITHIKELVPFDTRKIRQDKRVGKTLDTLYLHKKQADQAEQLRIHGEQIAKLILAQKQNDEKFNQIGNALLGLDEKLGALSTLGLSPKKIELYRLKLQNPDKTQQELGEMIGKPRLTVIRWLKDIDAITPKPV
jgi:hypothetical protein